VLLSLNLFPGMIDVCGPAQSTALYLAGPQ
jgi:hypothetical protein